jgi:perosamine synthetase
MNKIPVYQPYLQGNEKKYVNDCLDSTWISSKGQYIEKFEDHFRTYIGSSHAISVCNGTVALHLALLALDLVPGDEVIVPTLTYVASVNAIIYVGATPVFADSLSSTWQVDPEDVKRKITPKTKAILAVHLYGHPCDLGKLKEIADEFGIFLIEDCAEAFGSYFKDKHVGNHGAVSTFSFFGNKTITTGEGGMVVVNDPHLFQKIVTLKCQGNSPNRTYWHEVVGYNYRMTNIAAAIGLAQIEQAEEILLKKRKIAEDYAARLKDLPVFFHFEAPNYRHSYWMISILVDKASMRDPLRDFLASRGIETRPFFYPIHHLPMYKGVESGLSCTTAMDLSYRGINLPSYPALTSSEVEFICEQIKIFYSQEISSCSAAAGMPEALRTSS